MRIEIYFILVSLFLLLTDLRLISNSKYDWKHEMSPFHIVPIIREGYITCIMLPGPFRYDSHSCWACCHDVTYVYQSKPINLCSESEIFLLASTRVFVLFMTRRSLVWDSAADCVQWHSAADIHTMFTVLAKDRKSSEDEAQDIEGDLTSITAQDPLREDPLSEFEGI